MNNPQIIYYNIKTIHQIIGGSIVLNNPKCIITDLLTDSRLVVNNKTTLFFAINSSNRNAHFFIDELYKKGVINFVITQKIVFKKYPNANFILVDDALKALQNLVIYHKQKFNANTIGITGSNGKTVVKEWLYEILSNSFSISKSPKSYNSQIGVPLSVWCLNQSNNLAIYEAGISQINEMHLLEKIIQPNIGIFTNIGNAHDDGFESETEKIKEKLKLFVNVNFLVYNTNYKNLNKIIQQQKASENLKAKLINWGKEDDCFLKIISIQKEESQTIIKGKFTGNKKTNKLTIPFTNDAAIENAIHVWVTEILLIPEQKNNVNKHYHLHPIEMRLQQIKGINNCNIIDDSYSMDATSLHIALQVLKQQNKLQQKHLIISDIDSVSKNKKAEYEKIAALITQQKINKVITIGNEVDKLKDFKNKLRQKNIAYKNYLSTQYFLENINQNNFTNAAILVKGARKFNFEKIVNALAQKNHQTQLTINLNALANNIKEVRKNINSSTLVMAMVKAFSYGIGNAEVAVTLKENGVNYLAVAYADEGIDLRKEGIDLPIMVMSPNEKDFNQIVDNKLEPEIFSFSILDSFSLFLKSKKIKNYPIHLKIDTGMHRLGFLTSEVKTLCNIIKHNKHLKVKSIFSHLVASDDATFKKFTQQQNRLFKTATTLIETEIGYKTIKHICNSAAITNYKNMHYQMVRIGIGMYGFNSSNTLISKPVANLTTTITQIKNVKKGDTVGYNRNEKLTRNSKIAVIKIGYADGYPRSLGNGNAYVLVNNKPAKTLGNICMDMTMIDVTDIDNVNEGTIVTIFGEGLPINKLAQWAGTISYEIISSLSYRIKRVYVQE